ncbi:MAG: hydrogenase nickel incorporation protein HypB [Clostridiales bacterium]|nr:hydrogenase nickel incorporation protein HypB [Clostridiales bacterium]
MGSVKTIQLSKSIYEDTDAEANELREYLKEKGVFLVNIMSSPGAGKTTTLISLINRLSKHFRIGVMEADIDSDVDAVKIADKTGCKSVQLHTGGMCHLDAAMTRQGLDALGIDDLDLVFLENVGNLVCPAEFDTGATMSMTILSVSEGDDKPLKYPLIYQKCDLVLINKIDAMPYFTFNLDRCIANIKMRNGNSTIIPISAKTGENMSEVEGYFINKTISGGKCKNA